MPISGICIVIYQDVVRPYQSPKKKHSVQKYRPTPPIYITKMSDVASARSTLRIS